MLKCLTKHKLHNTREKLSKVFACPLTIHNIILSKNVLTSLCVSVITKSVTVKLLEVTVQTRQSQPEVKTALVKPSSSETS